jgi:tRNA pseudouridine55 synthase
MARRVSAASLDGALVIDKPAHMTSHDVVASVRRALGGVRAGHTGTLDPMATGVLPLLVGRATRLAQFLTDARKTYDAVVRFGWATDTYDATGEATGPLVRVVIDRDRLAAALTGFRGPLVQRPPAFSAKKVEGTRAYRLARRDQAPELASVPVTVHALVLAGCAADTAMLHIECSSGFYVRSLAHDLGQALGIGAHLASLRRTSSGIFGLERAIGLEAVLRDPDRAAAALVPMADVLPGLVQVVLGEGDITRVARGQDVAGPPDAGAGPVRLMSQEGRLVAIATRSGPGALLHPVVVLG